MALEPATETTFSPSMIPIRSPAGIPKPGDCLFVSLGPFAIHETKDEDGNLIEVLGGAGAYATIGARMAVPVMTGSVSPQHIGASAAVGDDFPEIDRSGEPSSRAELRTTPSRPKCPLVHKKHEPLEPWNLSLQNLKARYFHIHAGPSRLISLVQAIRSLRDQASIPLHPRIIWEPDTSQCCSANWGDHYHALKLVDVFAPSTRDVCRLLYDIDPVEKPEHLTQTRKHVIAEFAELLIEQMRAWTPHPAIIMETDDFTYQTWLPEQCAEGPDPREPPQIKRRSFPSQRHSHFEDIVDTTGSKSAFLGAWAVTRQCVKFEETAGLAGAVAASCVGEQAGPPRLRRRRWYTKWNEMDIKELGKHYFDEKWVMTQREYATLAALQEGEQGRGHTV